MDDISSVSSVTTKRSEETVKSMLPLKSEHSVGLVHREYVTKFTDFNSESRELANWNSWLERRKKQHDRLRKILNREPKCMMMNSENVYEKIRNGQLIEYAEGYKRFDKYRGDPKFWKCPEYLKDKYTDDNLVCSVKDKFDRTVIDENKPPNLQFIGIPEPILEEKDIRKIDKKNKCYYFDERVLKLKDNVELIQGYVPDLDNLVVIGHNYVAQEIIAQEQREVKLPDVPEVIIDCQDSGDTEQDYFYPALKINGQIIDSGTENVNFCIEFRGCVTGKPYRNVLLVENVGNASVKYSFEPFQQRENTEFPLMYTIQLRKRFLYPPDRDVFLPGRIVEIPFWFKSREPGVFHETVQLSTDPVVTEKGSILINLMGHAKLENINTKYLEIEKYIEKCIATSCAQKVLSEICFLHTEDTDLYYQDLFTNKEIFSHNNPYHFYDHKLVEKLLKINSKISDQPWDYSIVSIRNNILNNVGSIDEKRSYMDELFKISRNLLTPQKAFDLPNEKYRSVYQILCTFANKMHKDSIQLKKVYNIIQEKSPLNLSRISLETGKKSSKTSMRSSDETKTPKKLLNHIRKTSSYVSSKNSLDKSKSISKKKTPSKKEFSDTLQKSIDYKDEITLRQISVSDHVQDDLMRCEYIQSFYTRTYYNLSVAIDQITAALETQKLYQGITIN